MNAILRSMTPRIHPDGWRFILPCLVVTLFFLAQRKFLIPAIIGPVIFFLLIFFRDPIRVPPKDRNVVVAPADGLIVFVGDATAPPELEMKEPCIRISVFLNLLDVHVNRVPMTGIVVALKYRKGRWWSTAIDKSSEENERMAIRIDSNHGFPVAVCQIAGPFVRRIRCDLKVNENVELGAKFGLIRFGSRTDIYLPKNVHVWVRVGQRAIGGETIFASVS